MKGININDKKDKVGEIKMLSLQYTTNTFSMNIPRCPTKVIMVECLV